MRRLLYTQNKVFWLPEETIVETYLSDELPPLELCPSSYAFVFKDGAFLQTDLRAGERPERILDIPGGHVDAGETPDVSVVRETFEETGVRVKNPKLVGYKKITHVHAMPEGWRYPYPTGYMLYYICEVEQETPFEGNEDTHGRVWVPKGEYDTSPWYVAEKGLVDAVIEEFL